MYTTVAYTLGKNAACHSSSSISMYLDTNKKKSNGFYSESSVNILLTNFRSIIIRTGILYGFILSTFYDRRPLFTKIVDFLSTVTFFVLHLRIGDQWGRTENDIMFESKQPNQIFCRSVGFLFLQTGTLKVWTLL
jgi:hypothetical protein